LAWEKNNNKEILYRGGIGEFRPNDVSLLAGFGNELRENQ
jgi:hypothetical protein